MKASPFTTSFQTVIPGPVMARVIERLWNGEDTNRVGSEEFAILISPDHGTASVEFEFDEVIEEAEQQIRFIREDLQYRHFTGEPRGTEVESVQTMRDFQ
jgi:hypothetical protein